MNSEEAKGKFKRTSSRLCTFASVFQSRTKDHRQNPLFHGKSNDEYSDNVTTEGQLSYFLDEPGTNIQPRQAKFR